MRRRKAGCSNQKHTWINSCAPRARFGRRRNDPRSPLSDAVPASPGRPHGLSDAIETPPKREGAHRGPQDAPPDDRKFVRAEATGDQVLASAQSLELKDRG